MSRSVLFAICIAALLVGCESVSVVGESDYQCREGESIVCARTKKVGQYSDLCIAYRPCP